MGETARLGHAPIAMRLVKGWAEEDDAVQAGDFFWETKDGKRSLIVAIPMNTGLHPVFTRWSIDHRNHCGAQWSWDGNKGRPTLTPSLHAVGTWHGYVRNGQLVEA